VTSLSAGVLSTRRNASAQLVLVIVLEIHQSTSSRASTSTRPYGGMEDYEAEGAQPSLANHLMLACFDSIGGQWEGNRTRVLGNGEFSQDFNGLKESHTPPTLADALG